MIPPQSVPACPAEACRGPMFDPSQTRAIHEGRCILLMPQFIILPTCRERKTKQIKCNINIYTGTKLQSLKFCAWLWTRMENPCKQGKPAASSQQPSPGHSVTTASVLTAIIISLLILKYLISSVMSRFLHCIWISLDASLNVFIYFSYYLIRQNI